MYENYTCLRKKYVEKDSKQNKDFLFGILFSYLYLFSTVFFRSKYKIKASFIYLFF